MTPADRQAAVLEFWFGPGSKRKWFVKDAAFDAEIARRFHADHERAAAGDLDHWMASGEGSLALVILLDQFSRNMFRGSARAFSADGKALAVATTALERGFDRECPPERRLFLYMPFMHSENLDDQRRCVELFRATTVDPMALKAAARHLEIIQRFGRFPHRNRVLGRRTTPEEDEFLTGPDSSF